MKDRVQLIAYVDRFGNGDLKSINELLTGTLEGLFGCAHLLPFFYPIDGADTGFDPIDHAAIDARLGDWERYQVDYGRIRDLMADLIVQSHLDRITRIPGLSGEG